MKWKNRQIEAFVCIKDRADSGFLERGYICIKGWVFTLLILSQFSLIVSVTVSYGYFKTGGREGVQAKPLWIYH